MSGWLLALTIIGGIVAYIIVGGFWGGAFHRSRTAACPKCSRDRYCIKEHMAASFFAGAFWIVTLPAVAGVLLSSRGERAATRAVDAANQRAEIAEAKAREDEANERRYRLLTRTT